MGLADRLAKKMVDTAEKAVTKAASTAKDAIEARSDGAGARLLELLRMDNERSLSIEALIVLLVDAVRTDDESRELSDRDVLKAAKRRYRRLGTVSLPFGPVGGYLVSLYCEAATLCDIVELRGQPLSDQQVASHLLVLWRAMPDAISATAAIDGTGPSVAATLSRRAKHRVNANARLPETITKRTVVTTLWNLRGAVSDAREIANPGLRENFFPGARVKTYIASAHAQLDDGRAVITTSAAQLATRAKTDPEETRVREYLAQGPPGPRTEWLMWRCVHRMGELPIAAAEHFGQVVTVADLQPATQAVCEVMQQDRDLSAWIARKAALNLQVLIDGAMPGDFGTSLQRAFSAMGLSSLVGQEGVAFVNGAGDGLPHDEANAAKAMGDLVIMMMTILVTPAPERPQTAGWSFFVELYTNTSGDAEERAYDLIAWMAVMIARARAAGAFTADVPFFSPQWARVPRLTEPGWYPNPPKHGEAISGVSQFQRHWDGTRWTDRVRVMTRSGWQVGSDSLHDAPSN